MSSRFVKPAVVRIPLPSPPDGDCIEVKKELTVGDQKRLEAAGMKRVQRKQANGTYAFELETDWETYEIGRAEVWLTDWSGPSFLNEDGTPIALSFASLRALSPEAFALIDAAIDAHVAKMEQEKKLKASTLGSSDGTASPS